jgi:hypothetical protein
MILRALLALVLGAPHSLAAGFKPQESISSGQWCVFSGPFNDTDSAGEIK